MGIARLSECVRNLKPDAFIGVPKSHLLRIVKRGAFSSVRHTITVGRKWLPWGGLTLDALLERFGRGLASESFPIADTKRSDAAAIVFTTGSTGPAKGVVYAHGMFDAQTKMLRELFDIRPGDIDCPGFPLFALNSIALGMAAVIPDMNPAKPAQVDPAKFVEAIIDNGVTFSFGSPAIWRRVAEYCNARGLTLPTLKRVVSAGAPVPGDLIRDIKKMIPNGEVYIPYGATECLPAALFNGTDVLAETWQKTLRGDGICVGNTVHPTRLAIIRPSDRVIETMETAQRAPDGEIGEICFSGPQTTKEYYGLPDAPRLAKIQYRGADWHRMGDVGHIGTDGRLWFCGRMKNRVIGTDESGQPQVWYPDAIEPLFNVHPDAHRTALVGIGKPGAETPVLIVEPRAGRYPKTTDAEAKFIGELRTIAAAHPSLRGIQTFMFHPSFPVDIRHNIKIFREKLKVWAETQAR